MIITLTTDFGMSDGYVGVLKGVMQRIAPAVTIIDISHDIPACDIKSGAWVLNNSYRYFPNGTIHLCIVDPGVGSERKGIMLKSANHYFVGPDNGVFTHIYNSAEQLQAVQLTAAQYWLPVVSNTFHGRDIFAPVCAHLAMAEEMSAFGPKLVVDDLVRFRPAPVAAIGQEVIGSIVYIDRFGNLITNISADYLERAEVCLIAGQTVPVGKTYASAARGAACAYKGSHGCVEVGVNQGDARYLLHAHQGTEVKLVLAQQAG